MLKNFLFQRFLPCFDAFDYLIAFFPFLHILLITAKVLMCLAYFKGGVRIKTLVACIVLAQWLLNSYLLVENQVTQAKQATLDFKNEALVKEYKIQGSF